MQSNISEGGNNGTLGVFYGKEVQSNTLLVYYFYEFIHVNVLLLWEFILLRNLAYVFFWVIAG